TNPCGIRTIDPIWPIALQLSTKYRSRSREVWIECNRDLSTKHVPDSADACWLALSHVTSSPRSATH
ncbi:hypothetical protein JS562_54410, partial [Agrobacterium sp. S2]|nr:hypothetical protein [Agrobacterium sp. S2]